MSRFFVPTHASRETQSYQMVKDTTDSYNALVDLFESIDHFLKRLNIYTKIPPTAAITEMVVKILVELLSALALATKQITRGKPRKSVFREKSYYLA
jgi:hypothetical protein